MRDHYNENRKLLDRIREGDPTARTELAEANMGLVHWTADRIMAGSWTEGDARWQEREERVERGYHGLCKACAKIENVRSSVGGYLRTAIYNAMVREDKGLVKWLPPKKRVFGTRTGKVDPGDDRRLNPLRVFWDQEAYDDTLALIYWCCGDRIDRHIIDKRIEGLAITAVARDLGVRWPEVKRRLLRIEVEFWRIRKSG